MADKASVTRAAEAACVEDYNDDSQTAVPETKKTANITAKRSKPDVARLQVVHDEVSDSGHSNQTLATLGSTNTSLESKSGSHTIRAGSMAVAGKTSRTKIDEKPRGRSQSPEKINRQRGASKGRKEEIGRKEKEPCRCSECVAKAHRATPHYPSKSTGKARRPVPEISQHIRLPPVQLVEEVPILQYPTPRPRASTSRSYHRDRPQSLYAGAAPEPLYIQTQQPIYNEPRPTLSYPPTAPIIAPSYPSHPTQYIPPTQPLQQPLNQPQPQQFYTSPPSPYDFQARPLPRQWASDYQAPPRPQSMLYTTPPIIEYVAADPVYTPVPVPVQPLSRQSSHRERPRALPEQRSARDEDYYKMPPPAPPPPAPRYKDTSHQDRRPAIRHTVTADAHPTYTHRRTTRDESIMAHVAHESHAKQIHGGHERARRPSRTTSDEAAPNIQGIERGMARTNIGSDAAKRRRRASLYGHETFNELTEEVEAYQASKGNGRTSNHIPIPAPALVRKGTHTSSKSSETSSRKSGKSRTSRTSREGSDLKSRRPGENDNFSMRVDASHGVNVDLKGGMEGRRISVRQNKDEGEMEFSIGSRGRTATGTGRDMREKSRKRSAYRNGQSETAIERSRTMSRPRMKIKEKAHDENETEPRIVRERITTRTRSRRGSSRPGGERVGFI